MIYHFLGHFHPLLVHIPIGVLLLAFILEFFVIKKNAVYSFIIEITLLIGCIAGILSALLGWFLSDSGEYDVALLTRHQWLGISLCCTTFFLWGLKKFARPEAMISRAYSPLFFVTMLLLLLTGHFGGSLTHGEDYLSFQAMQLEEKKSAAAPVQKQIQFTQITPDLTVYNSLVNPIFTSKCTSCHNEKKKKGNFQLHTFELLLKGGKSGKKMIADSVENSELVRRMLLDKNEEKHMPPKGKRQLTKAEIDLIYWWIQNGASPEKKLIAVKTNDTIKAFFANQESVIKPALHLQNVKEANPADLLPFEKIHWLVKPVSKGSPFLEVNAINVPSLNDTYTTLLLKIAPQVAWLQLADTKITDAGMADIAKCPNVLKLNLKNTGITNASLQSINQLKQLEYLNIVGTGIDDIGLLQLNVNKSLKKLFCWDSKITKEGVARFKALNPSVEIDFFNQFLN